MISAGVCGFGSALSTEACATCFTSGLFTSGLALDAGTICASAEASWRVAATGGFARGVGTGSADLAGAAAAITLAGAGFSFLTGALAPSSSSSVVDLPLLNSEANRFGILLTVAASLPLPRRSMSARASS